jgi:hypothetical protein
MAKIKEVANYLWANLTIRWFAIGFVAGLVLSVFV